MSKPIDPKPEDFGLTTERVKKLDNGFDLGKAPIVIYFCLALVAVIVLNIKSSQSWLGLLMWSFIVVAFFTILLPIFPLSYLLLRHIAVVIWRRHQRDYVSFINFNDAQKKFKQDYLHWLKAQESWWQQLDGRAFEIELMELFRNQGFKVQWTGKTGDGGVDLILNDHSGKTVLVQCKAHSKFIGPGPVRDLFGTLLHRGGNEAWLISTSGFSKQAQLFARSKPIKLFSIRDLLELKSLYFKETPEINHEIVNVLPTQTGLYK